MKAKIMKVISRLRKYVMHARKFIRRHFLSKAWRYRELKILADVQREQANRIAADAHARCYSLSMEVSYLKQPLLELEAAMREDIAKDLRKLREWDRLDVMNALLKLVTMADYQLVEASKYDVYEDEEEGYWRIAETICAFGGCYIPFEVKHTTRRAALLEACIRTAFGGKLETGGVCSDCYEDYQRYCVG